MEGSLISLFPYIMRFIKMSVIFFVVFFDLEGIMGKFRGSSGVKCGEYTAF